jgi:Lrp/AsnC family transcriptional regulator for asnA, asnC and gidA
MQSGLLDINGQVDIEQIPHHQLVIIGVKLKTTDMFKKGQEFSQVKGVVSVSVVTGRYDLMLLVIFNEEYGLQEFYAQEVSRIDDVQSLETFVVYKGYNLKVPYIL